MRLDLLAIGSVSCILVLEREWENRTFAAGANLFAQRITKEEAVAKCLKEFIKEDIKLDTNWWGKTAKVGEVYRGTSRFVHRDVWEYKKDFWAERYLHLYVVLIATSHNGDPYWCEYDLSSGHVVKVDDFLYVSEPSEFDQ